MFRSFRTVFKVANKPSPTEKERKKRRKDTVGKGAVSVSAVLYCMELYVSRDPGVLRDAERPIGLSRISMTDIFDN